MLIKYFRNEVIMEFFNFSGTKWNKLFKQQVQEEESEQEQETQEEQDDMDLDHHDEDGTTKVEDTVTVWNYVRKKKLTPKAGVMQKVNTLLFLPREMKIPSQRRDMTQMDCQGL